MEITAKQLDHHPSDDIPRPLPLPEPSPPTPLVYNDSMDTSIIQNIMLIDSEMGDSQTFYYNVNSNTFPILYSYHSSKEDLYNVLKQKFSSSIQRISLVFHDKGPNLTASFLDNQLLFQDADLDENQTEFSENVSFLIKCIQEFHVHNIDFLACNTLQYDNWKKYYTILSSKTSVVVGASNNNTGNINYGGDWVMENTSEDIKNMYFNESISNYASTLDSTISANGATQSIYLKMNGSVIAYSISSTPPDENTNYADIPYANWPVTIENTDTNNPKTILNVIFTESLTISNSYANTNGYFIAGSQYITFDGMYNGTNYIMNINDITNYSGLIQNGTSGANGFSNITVQNIITNVTGTSSLADSAGWICLSYFGKGANNNLITTCSTNGTINGFASGGIIGQNSVSSGSLSITNCYTTGAITGSYAGGIAGADLANSTNNTTYITNCYSLGNITDSNAGGIAGSGCANSSGSVTITNCYTYGTGGNGIVGIASTGTLIQNCYRANGTWTDATANDPTTGLTGTPTNVTTNNPAVTWTTVGTDIPYILSVFNNQVYDPNTGSTSVFPYNTTSGLFLPDYTYSIINNVVQSNVYTSYVFVTKASSPYYFNYNVNTFTLTNNDSNVDTTALSSTINSTSGVLTTNITISANGATESIYLKMNGSDIAYSISSTLPDENTNYTDISSWPVTIVNTDTNPTTALNVIFTESLTISSSYANTNGYFIAGSQYITFDGMYNGTNYIMNIENITGYTGLIQNGTSGANGFSNITVQNIISNVANGTLSANAGWICASYFGKGATDNSITNCTNNGEISDQYAGGIAGSYAGSSSGSITFSDCSNLGNFVNASNDVSYTGGIAGAYAGQGGSATFTTCSNTGNISTYAQYAGGIVGGNAGLGGFATFTNCSNTGSISGSRSGGIAGAGAGYQSGSATFTTCSNTGEISADSAGGIAGQGAGQNGSATFTNCSNTGNISTYAQDAGGIAGLYAGLGGSATFTTCTNSGSISGDSAGGIAGSYAGYNSGSATFTTCTNNANISGSNAGGIAGANAGSNNGSATFTTCKNTGSISGQYAGGIAGSNVGRSGTATLNSCSNTGVISGSSAGGIAGYQCGYYGIANFNNCTNNGEIASTAENAGGIAGSYAGFIGAAKFYYCTNTGAINAVNAGGIVGDIVNDDAELNDCINTGAINAQYAGGIAGSRAERTIFNNCINIGSINAPNTGGIAGYGADNNVVVNNCINNGEITSIAQYAGGILGSNATTGNGNPVTVTKCINNGAINASNAGGMVGADAGVNAVVNISYCINNGAINGSSASAYAGTTTYTNNVIITNCYSN